MITQCVKIMIMIPVHWNVLQEALRTIPKDYKVKLV